MKAKITGTKYIVIQQSAWCNDSGSGIYYSSDLVEFEKRDKAIKHGLKQCDSDDFNIGVLVNGRLTSLDWMAKVVDDEPEILAEISEQLGLDSDSKVRPAPIAPDDYFASLVAKARLSADKAMNKHPQPNYVLLKVAEEAGEVVQAGVHFAENRMTWDQVEGEIVQLMAMLIRLVTEGDQVNGITPPDTCRAAMPAEPVSQGYTLLAGENCWSCGKYFTYAQHSECDGYCPHCNAPVDLEDREDQPSPSVPDEMTGAIAMTQYGIKPSNYKQWVKGWNACRAARIRLSGSSEQKGKRLRIAEGKFAAYFPQERPLSGARVIAWDENGNLLGVGFGLYTRQTGIAIIINGKKYDSNHVIHWCNSPVDPDGCGTMPNGQPAAHVSLESFSSDGTSDIMTKNLPIGTALFTAPQVPSVTRDLLDAMTEVIRISDRDHEAWSRAKNAIAICRAAIPATAPDEIDIFVDQVCGNLPTGHQQ